MRIEYVEGDLFSNNERMILHGCNAQGVMGSGIAKIVNERFNYAFLVYRQAYLSTGLKVGEIVTGVPSPLSDDPIIFNGITQFSYGRDPAIRYVSYLGIREVIRKLSTMIRNQCLEEPPVIAMPQIGAGLGNGDWKVIEKIIEEEAIDFIPRVYILKEQKEKW